MSYELKYSNKIYELENIFLWAEIYLFLLGAGRPCDFSADVDAAVRLNAHACACGLLDLDIDINININIHSKINE